MKRFFAISLVIITALCAVGCRASTEAAALDDHGYTLTLNKRITVVSNQIVTQMTNARTMSEATKDSCIASAKASISIVAETIDEIEAVPAPSEYEANKQNVLSVMVRTKERMELFVARMENGAEGGSFNDIIDLLQNDYNALTAEFNVNYK